MEMNLFGTILLRSWRSPFHCQAGNRFRKKHGKSLAKPRSYGSPIDITVPACNSSWMKGTAGD